jgi:membrane protease YdiL (CAAX protease family)
MTRENKIKVLIVVGLILPIIFQLFSHVIQDNILFSRLAYGLSKLLFIGLPFVYWYINRATPKTPQSPMRLFSVVSGLVFALIIFGVLYTFIDEIKPLGEKIYQTLSNIGLTKNFLLYSLGIIIFNSLFEELYWRYSIFGGLKKFFSLNKAMLIGSLGFAAMHFVYFVSFFDAMWVILLLTSASFLFGMFWAWLYHKTNSVFWVWINHLLVNVPLFYIEYLIIFPT